MSLESAIADLVSASTSLTQSVNVTRAAVEATWDSVLAQEAPVTTAKDATTASATAATTDTATTASKLTAAAADYAAQKTTKGLAAVQTSADTELKDRLHRRDPASHPFRGARPSLVMDFVRRECHRNNAAGNLEQVDLSRFMIFTRGTTATYVGPDGLIKTQWVNKARYGYDPVTGEALGLLIEEQRTNLSNYSQALHRTAGVSNASYIAGVAISPTGLCDAGVFLESPVTSYHYLDLGATLTVGKEHVFSIFVKAAGRSYANILFKNSATFTAVGFDLITKTTTANTCGCTQSPNSGISDVGNGWLRLWAAITPVVDGYVSYRVTTSDGTTWLTAGDATKGLYLWGAQVEAGSFPTSYIPTPATFTGRASTKTYFDSNGVMQTAANDVAVTDYGYVDGRWVSKGLSLEPQATNLLLSSTPKTGAAAGAPSSALWVGNSEVLGLNAVSVSGNDWVEIATPLGGNVSIAASVPYCFSLFSNKSTPLEMRINDQADYRTTTVVPLGENTFRHYVVGSVSTSLTTALHIRYANGHTVTGFQLEAGSYPTSYIPTTTAQVTRAADTSTSAQVTRANDVGSTALTNWYRAEMGTLTGVSSTFCTLGVQNPCVASIESGISNHIQLALSPAATAYRSIGRLVVGGVSILENETSAYITTGANSISSVRYGSSVSAGYGMGGTLIKNSATYPVVPTTLMKLGVGYGCGRLCGYIKQLTYFPRALSDADLQALTILED